MRCAAHVIAVGAPAGAAREAQARIERLEAQWSRFRPRSDVARCNRAHGAPTTVSASTIRLFRCAVEGWRQTAGRYDPTILRSLEAMGYDRSFERLSSSVHPAGEPAPAPGCWDFEIDEARRTVRMPAGVAFDPGGIGKGLAAELVVEELLEKGAAGVCVNLGGDLQVAGEDPNGGGWLITVEDPYDRAHEVARTLVTDAGVATTSRTYRTWERAGVQIHHLIDPFSGAPAWTDLASVTVVAESAWWAEVLAKAAFVSGPVDGGAAITAAGASGVLVDDGGGVTALPGCDWEVVSPCSE
jgi:thiamine biosynthesis lipoprotein